MFAPSRITCYFYGFLLQLFWIRKKSCGSSSRQIALWAINRDAVFGWHPCIVCYSSPTSPDHFTQKLHLFPSSARFIFFGTLNMKPHGTWNCHKIGLPVSAYTISWPTTRISYKMTRLRCWIWYFFRREIYNY